jgi:hypothetical protein
MRIDEACINHNAVKIIDALSDNIYAFCDGDMEQNRMYMAMTLGEIAGVIDMAKALKEVLKA